MFYKRLEPSFFCVCGEQKEDREKRYCKRCGSDHGMKMSAAHRGKGTGPRKKSACNLGIS